MNVGRDDHTHLIEFTGRSTSVVGKPGPSLFIRLRFQPPRMKQKTCVHIECGGELSAIVEYLISIQSYLLAYHFYPLLVTFYELLVMYHSSAFLQQTLGVGTEKERGAMEKGNY
ncbi:unnamed protein product [Hydatigera taeniaeformis]|uniref:Uncharacterized protein n=1 Tax=Hydatigena taeniaeformis TaxID=6205 RepID=A0A0R3WNF4_HYDTA|nr:unnamed protein product [Hydatigera taeniaeformis]